MNADQMKELAARLRKMAELFRMMLASSTNTAEPVWVDLDAAADLIDSMAQRVPLTTDQMHNRKPVATIYIVDGSMTIDPGLVVTSEAGEVVFDVYPREA